MLLSASENPGIPDTSRFQQYWSNKLRPAPLIDTDPGVYTLPSFKGRIVALAFENPRRTTELVIGTHNLLGHLAEIHQLRVRCGQEFDLATDPEYFIASSTLKNQRVAAVLIRRDHELEACVLFFEHTLFGMGLGLMRGGDAVGESYVTGAEAFRLQHIHVAAQALLRHRRVYGVSLTIKASLDDCVAVMGPGDRYRVFTERTPVHKLKLAESYAAMLASMGPRTRRSLATKRRQLEQNAQVSFLPTLEPAQALEVMTLLRSRSYPERISKFYDARYRLLCERSEMFTMGMRLPDGTWLSVLGGWRRDGITFIDLQMNDKHFKKESISAVMRAFLLEHEIARQQKMIYFVGGCSILLGRYCEPSELCTDIILSRPCLRSWIFGTIVPYLKPESPYSWLAAGPPDQ